jgi:DNA-binding MarR family transcriptional regulator
MDSASRLLSPALLDDLLLYRVNRLQMAAGSIVVRYCEGQFGITRREWRIVAALAAHGPMSSSELAGHAHLDRPRTSKAVTSLVEKGLLSRVTLAGDARRNRLALTGPGQALYAQLFPLVAGINRELLAVLDHAGLKELDGILRRLQERADELAAREGWPQADRRHGGSRRRPR